MDNLSTAFDNHFEEVASVLLYYNNSISKTEVSRQIKQFYFDDNQPISKQTANLINMFSDRVWFRPFLQALKLHNGSAYVFNLAYNNRAAKHPNITGSAHGDMTILLWQQEGYNLDQNATALSKQLVKMFVDFVKFGNPTPPGSSDFIWPQWNETEPFFTIDTYGHFREDHGFYTERMQFWQKLYEFAPDIDVY